MWNTEKKINKRLIWLIIWSAAVWWLASTKKWQSIAKTWANKAIDSAKSFLEFVKWWVQWLQESINQKIGQKNDEKPKEEN